jgi:hypothetical protein
MKSFILAVFVISLAFPVRAATPSTRKSTSNTIFAWEYRYESGEPYDGGRYSRRYSKSSNSAICLLLGKAPVEKDGGLSLCSSFEDISYRNRRKQDKVPEAKSPSAAPILRRTRTFVKAYGGGNDGISQDYLGEMNITKVPVLHDPELSPFECEVKDSKVLCYVKGDPCKISMGFGISHRSVDNDADSLAKYYSRFRFERNPLREVAAELFTDAYFYYFFQKFFGEATTILQSLSPAEYLYAIGKLILLLDEEQPMLSQAGSSRSEIEKSLIQLQSCADYSNFSRNLLPSGLAQLARDDASDEEHDELQIYRFELYKRFTRANGTQGTGRFTYGALQTLFKEAAFKEMVEKSSNPWMKKWLLSL